MSEAEPAPEAQLDLTALMRGIVDDLRRTDGFKGRAKASALAMIGVQISQFGAYVQQAEPEIPDDLLSHFDQEYRRLFVMCFCALCLSTCVEG